MSLLFVQHYAIRDFLSGNHHPHLARLDLSDCYDTLGEFEINILVDFTIVLWTVR